MHKQKNSILSLNHKQMHISPEEKQYQTNKHEINNKNKYDSFIKLPKLNLVRSTSQSIISMQKLLSGRLYANNMNSRNQRLKEIPHQSSSTKSHCRENYKEKIKRMLNKSIYHIDHKTQQKLEDIKKNQDIALKDDFNLKEYQNSLFQFIGNKSSLESYRCLRDSFQSINDILKSKRGKVKSNEKWKKINLSIRPFAPQFLIDKFKFMNGKVY